MHLHSPLTMFRPNSRTRRRVLDDQRRAKGGAGLAVQASLPRSRGDRTRRRAARSLPTLWDAGTVTNRPGKGTSRTSGVFLRPGGAKYEIKSQASDVGTRVQDGDLHPGRLERRALRYRRAPTMFRSGCEEKGSRGDPGGANKIILNHNV